MNNIHFPIGTTGGVTFSVEMRSGEGVPLGPVLCINSQQNGHQLNSVQIFTDAKSLRSLADFLTLQAKAFSDMEDNDEIIHHPLKSTYEPPYNEE